MSRFLSLVAITAALIAVFLSGCAKSTSTAGSPLAEIKGSASSGESLNEKTARLLAETTGKPYWKKRWWLEKTARLLRGGRGLSDRDNPDELIKLSEEEIAGLFMKDELFGDAILDFNSARIGRKAPPAPADSRTGHTRSRHHRFYPLAPQR